MAKLSLIIRPGEAEAVLQTPLSLMNCQSPDFPIPTSQTTIWRVFIITRLVVWSVCCRQADDSSYLNLAFADAD